MIAINSIDFDDGNGFTLHAVHQAGADRVVTKLDGWWSVAPRTTWEDAATDGAFGDVLWREGRQLTLGVTEILPDRQAVEARARQVAACFASGQAGNGTLTVAGITDTLTCYGLALDGEPKVTHNLANLRVSWELPLFAPDPYLYGPAQNGQVSTSDLGFGLEYELFDDLSGVLEFGAPQVVEASLTNPGNHPAYPLVLVAGDFPSGFSLDLVGDKAGDGPWGVTYRGNVTRTSPVTVDFTGRAHTGGVDVSWLLTRRAWGGVAPGGQVTARLTPAGGGAGWADVSLHPTYL